MGGSSLLLLLSAPPVYAPLFDRFVGGAGVLTGHSSDSGHSWGPSGSALAISGGSAYSPPPTADSGLDYGGVSTWNPGTANYAAAVVFGAGFRQPGMNVGLLLRASASSVGNYSWYAIYVGAGSTDTLFIVNQSSVNSTLGTSYILGTQVPLSAQIATNNTLEASISGLVTPVITVYINGLQIYQATDSGAGGANGGVPIVAQGSAGIAVSSSTGDNVTDVIRTIWAGAYGGPAGSMSPSSAMLTLSGTATFSAVGLLPVGSPTETVTWSSTRGSVTAGSYTAPSSGATDAVTWTSVDLPMHSASAAITLATGASPVATGVDSEILLQASATIDGSISTSPHSLSSF